MRKLKFLILTLLSVLTLGLFVVTGSKVEAAIDDYTITLPSTISDSNVALPSGWSGKVRTDSKTFAEEPNKGKKALTLRAGQNPEQYIKSPDMLDSNDELIATSCTVSVGCAYNDTSSGTISVESLDNSGNTIQSKSETISNSLSTYEFTFNDLTLIKNIKIFPTQGTKNLLIDTVTINYGSTESSKTFTGLTVINTSAYNVDDTFSTDGLTVTALFDDETSSPLKAGYSTSFSPELVNGKFTSATTYVLTVTAEIGEIEKTATTNIVVTEVKKWTVTYYDGKGDSHTLEVKDKEAFTQTATKDKAKFIGWSTNENSSVADADVSSITADITLYPVFSNLVTLTSGVEKSFISSSVSGSVTGDSYKFSSDMSLYSYSSGSNITFGNNKISISASGSNSDNYIGFMVPANTKIRIDMNATLGGANSTYIKVQCGDEISVIDMGSEKKTYQKQVFLSNVSNNPEMVYIYRTGGTNPSKASGITINSLNVFADTRISTFYCQYNTSNPANATKIRFIAALDGIDDVTAINTVTFSITVGEDTKEFKCTQLYSSIANQYASLGSSEGRCYAVYALTGIENAIASEVAIQSLSVTITFTEASGLSPITASHAGFTIGE